MREKFSRWTEKHRITEGIMASSEGIDGANGLFIFNKNGKKLRAVISDELGWDHVSVSTKTRVPTWKEMCWIKDLFFDDEETVVQYHPKKSAYVNDHPYTLHLWRNQATGHDLPPTIMV